VCHVTLILIFYVINRIWKGQVRCNGTMKYFFEKQKLMNFCVLLTVHLHIILDNDQLDTQLLYLTIRALQSSTCFEHYMLIIRRLNCIDAASGIVTLTQ